MLSMTNVSFFIDPSRAEVLSTAIDFHYAPLILLSLMAVFGNVMVIASVLVEKRLRSLTTNHFVASLAVSDLFVGALAMPFAVYIKMNNNMWNLSRTWCQFHLGSTVFATAASILNLVAISVDRYFAIIFPTEYQRHSMRARSMPYVAMLWFVSIAVSAPILLEDVTLEEGRCWIEDPQYLIMSALLTFFIPACIIVYLYAKIFRRIRKHLNLFWSGARSGGSHARGKFLASVVNLPQVIVEEVRSRRNSRIDNNSLSGGSRSQSRKTSAADGAAKNRSSSMSLDVPFSEADLIMALSNSRSTAEKRQSALSSSASCENVTVVIPTFPVSTESRSSSNNDNRRIMDDKASSTLSAEKTAASKDSSVFQNHITIPQKESIVEDSCVTPCAFTCVACHGPHNVISSAKVDIQKNTPTDSSSLIKT